MDSKRVLLVGATGFIGRSLGIALSKAGYDLTVVTRNPSKARNELPFPCDTVAWGTTDGNTKDFELPLDAIEKCNIIINLAGESIADGRWTRSRKEELRDSRVKTTEAIARAVRQAKSPPAAWIQTSATGFYGPRGDEELSESSPLGTGFLADICRDWEEAAKPAQHLGVRLVFLRVGVVLGLDGGALPKLTTLRQRGASIVIGSGSEWLSWIHVDDLVRLFLAAVEDQRFQGPVNAIAPHPCTWRDLESELPVGALPPLKAPTLAIRIASGEGPLALAVSQKIIPSKALGFGFQFLYPHLPEALEQLLGPKPDRGDGWIYTRQFIPAPPSEVTPFFANEKNLEAITPPWLNFKVLDKSTSDMRTGTLIRYRLKLHGFPLKWVTRIADWNPGQGFVDEQLKGPYAKWVHRHSFEPFAGGTLMTDFVRYRLPLGTLGNIAAGWAVSHDVEKIFRYRRDYIGKLYQRDEVPET